MGKHIPGATYQPIAFDFASDHAIVPRNAIGSMMPAGALSPRLRAGVSCNLTSYTRPAMAQLALESNQYRHLRRIANPHNRQRLRKALDTMPPLHNCWQGIRNAETVQEALTRLATPPSTT